MASGDPQDAVEHVERTRTSATEASWALRGANRAAADVDQVLARRIGLRPLDYTAMGHILTTDGAIGPLELSTRLGISTGSTTELLDRLERAGHIQRQRDHHDRRRVSLRPTDAAVGRILGELAPLFTALDDLASEFTSPELDAVVRYLRRAAQILCDYDTAVEQPPRPR